MKITTKGIPKTYEELEELIDKAGGKGNIEIINIMKLSGPCPKCGGKTRPINIKIGVDHKGINIYSAPHSLYKNTPVYALYCESCKTYSGVSYTDFVEEQIERYGPLVMLLDKYKKNHEKERSPEVG